MAIAVAGGALSDKPGPGRPTPGGIILVPGPLSETPAIVVSKAASAAPARPPPPCCTQRLLGPWVAASTRTGVGADMPSAPLAGASIVSSVAATVSSGESSKASSATGSCACGDVVVATGGGGRIVLSLAEGLSAVGATLGGTSRSGGCADPHTAEAFAAVSSVTINTLHIFRYQLICELLLVSCATRYFCVTAVVV